MNKFFQPLKFFFDQYSHKKKDRIKNPDFRPTLKAHEMAQ